MSTAAPSGGSYDPSRVEPDIYAFWERGGHFAARINPGKKPYVIDIPLPNVTGALHLGHALNDTVQDVLVRLHRMRGYEAMWMPGTDHAGIATQAVVERKLKEEHNLTRHELGRDALVQKIWEWKEEYGGRILKQLRLMGFSCDWARTRFTLDEVCGKAVYEVFFQWFKAGLIYRGVRLVNWDAHLQTAVADDEVIYETVKGSFWHFRYPILEAAGSTEQRPEELRDANSEPRPPGSGSSFRAMETVPEDIARAAIARATRADARLGYEYMVIATTRPETMLGDVALCVHPDDLRYQHVIGKHVLLPLLNRAIPIIADAQLAKMELGAGCVKVTPAHDPKDYQCGLRHTLPMVNILTADGKINENGRGIGSGGQGADEGHEENSEPRPQGSGPSEPRPQGSESAGGRVGGYSYVGLPKGTARKQVVEDLQTLGLVEKIEDYETEVGHSDRSKTPIEPLLSEQWFVKMGDLAEMAMDAVRDGRVTFYPERYAKTFLDWLGEKRDWCISRQLWWGHRIPVWTLRFKASSQAEDHAAEAQGRAERGIHNYLHAYGRAIGADLSGDYRASCIAPGVFLLCCRTPELHEAMRILAASHASSGDSGAAARADADGAVQRLLARWKERAGGSGERDEALASSLEADLQELAARLESIEQDPDVLDTWFSSALWPFSTLGWPDDYGKALRREGTNARSALQSDSSGAACPGAAAPTDLDYFYPTTVLVTARDIITLWVARMVVAGLYFTQRVPFQHVHIHPNIQDAQGRRMNKSLGNGVDPLDIIGMFGADALRFTMVQIDSETQDARLPVMYRCPHCQGSFAQANEHLSKPVIKCRHCKKEFATRLANDQQISTLGLGVVYSDRFEMGRNFCNKLWQAATGFVLPNLAAEAHRAMAPANQNPDRRGAGPQNPDREGVGPQNPDREGVGPQNPDREGGASASALGRADAHRAAAPSHAAPGAGELPLEDRWILSRLRSAIERVDARFARYQLSDVAAAIYEFFWSDFCDWYVELVKPRLAAPSGDDQARRVLALVLDHSLRLMHPVMPFITEALWAKLNAAAPRRGLAGEIEGEPALIRAAWPDAGSLPRDPQAEREMSALQDVIRALRDALARINQARSAAKQPAVGKLPRAVLRVDAGVEAGLAGQRAVLERLGRCEAVEVGAAIAKPPECSTTVLPGVEVYVPLHGLMDLAAERTRLEKEREELRGHIERLDAKLANEGFVAKAPAGLIEQERNRLAEMRARAEVLERNLAEVGG